MNHQFENFEDFRAFAEQSVGAIMLTVSVLSDQGQSISRVYTTHPVQFPVGGRKTFGTDGDVPRAWLEQVMQNQQPFLAADKSVLRVTFSDHETSEALGGGAAINVPVVSGGRTIGSINFLDREGRYDESAVAAAVEIAGRSRQLLESVIAGRE